MLKPQMIRNHLIMFIISLIVNPAFSSQTKEILTTKAPDFGSKAPIPDDIKKKIQKGVMVDIQSDIGMCFSHFFSDTKINVY